MRRGDVKRQAILDAAEKLFYQKGYEATSIQDILDVLATSKGSFYHHFESKESVLITLCAQRAAQAVQAAEAALADIGDPLARLNTVLAYAIPLRPGEEAFLALLLPLADKPEGFSLRVGYQEALRSGFAPLAEEALEACCRAELAFPPENAYLPALLLDITNQCWTDMMREWMRGGDELEVGRLVERMELYRFTLWRLLDTPFGTLEVLRVPEMLGTLRSLAQREAPAENA